MRLSYCLDIAGRVGCSANQRIQSTLADGSYWIYGYDSLGQVTSGKRFWQDGTPVAGQQYEYVFDDIGNRKSASMGGNALWGQLRKARYDSPNPPNRLNQYVQREVPAAVDILGIANPAAEVTVNGNPASRKGEYFHHALSTPNENAPWYETVTVHTEYDSTEQTESGSVFVPRTPEQFSYDADGNLTQDGRWNYVWDAENRLVKLAPSTSTGPQISLRFEYDWQGRRIRKQVWPNPNWEDSPTNDVRFVYDGWNLVAILHSDFSLLNSLVWGSDLSGTMQGAGGVGGLLQVAYNGTQTTNCFVAFDGNGNVAALVDASDGTLAAQYEYGPFGEVIRATGPMAKANPFRFSTKYQDDETDLLYYGYRYYNPSTGKWMSRDPVGESGGLDVYGFCSNSPTERIDPNGHLPVLIPVAGGTLAAAACVDAYLCFQHLLGIQPQATAAAHEIMRSLDPNYDPQQNGPNREGSPADALRHCIGACMAHENPGACLSSAIVEWLLQRRDRGTGLNHEMDRANNEFAFRISGGDCRQACINALMTGSLQCFNPGDTHLSPCHVPGGR